MSTSSTSKPLTQEFPVTAGEQRAPVLEPEVLKARVQSLMVLGDLLSAVVAVFGGFVLYGVLPGDLHRGTILCFLTLAPCWLAALFLGGLYTLRPPRSPLVWAQEVCYATLQGGLLGIGLTFLLSPALLVGRLFYVLATCLAGLLFWIIRLVAVRYGPSSVVRERVLIVGTGKRCHSLMEALNNGRNPNQAQLIGAVWAGQDDGRAEDLPCPLLGGLADCMDIIAREAVNHVVITPAPPLTSELTHLAAHCDAVGLRVQGMEVAYEELTWRAPVFHTEHSWTAALESRGASKYATRFKRLVDLALTLTLMPLTLLILAVCGVLIKAFSRGPVFYHQERIGRDGVPFTFTKLRTMVVDAEKNTGPVWALANDPRITPIGRFLRKTRLDELPQLFSVLKG
ncbi:MAG: sugar transferase, partial [Armatimonadota bacterium]